MPRARRSTVIGLVTVAVAGCGGGAGKQDAAKTLDEVTGDLGQVVAEGREQLVELSKLPEVRARDAKKCSASLAKLKAPKPRYSAFGAAHIDGNLFCISIPRAQAVNVADRPYFQRAVKYRDFVVGDYQIGRVTKVQVVSMAYPLLDASRRAQGIVLASFDLPWLDRRLAKKVKGSGAEVVLVDSRGTVLARSPAGAGKVGSTTADQRLLTALRSGGRTATKTATYAAGPVTGTRGWLWVSVRSATK
jgi:hypothetical protein